MISVMNDPCGCPGARIGLEQLCERVQGLGGDSLERAFHQVGDVEEADRAGLERPHRRLVGGVQDARRRASLHPGLPGQRETPKRLEIGWLEVEPQRL
jgi:hypothetical protein